MKRNAERTSEAINARPAIWWRGRKKEVGHMKLISQYQTTELCFAHHLSLKVMFQAGYVLYFHFLSPSNHFFFLDETDQALGAKSFPPPYLAPNTQTEAILRGINYASGASGILDETGFFFVSTTLGLFNYK